MKKLVIFGAGYPIIIQLIEDINQVSKEKYEIVGFIVDDNDQKGADYFGYPILGKLEDIKIASDCYIINNIGSSTAARRKIDHRIFKKKQHIPSLIHPNVETRYSKIGNGCIISKDVFIGAGSVIGNSACLRNTIFIAHDVKIGDYVFVSDQSVILGHVKINDYAYIGANVTILPRLNLAQNCLVGAGSVVTKDIPANQVFVGNPAKFLKDNTPIPQ